MSHPNHYHHYTWSLLRSRNGEGQGQGTKDMHTAGCEKYLHDMRWNATSTQWNKGDTRNHMRISCKCVFFLWDITWAAVCNLKLMLLYLQQVESTRPRAANSNMYSNVFQ